MSDATPIELVVLAGLGFVAGWINTVAGSGSLLLLPALIFTGLDASEANATNRIGILAQSGAAVWGYRRAGVSIGPHELSVAAAAMIGGAIGAFLASLLAASEMQIAIVIAMAIMLVLSLLPARESSKQERAAASLPRREASQQERAAELAKAASLPRPSAAMLLAFVAIGIYGGFLQAGIGIVVLLYLSIAHGVGLLASNVVKSTITLALTLVAIAVFAWRGAGIDLVRGGVLAIASAGGGLLGAQTTVALGDRFVRAAVSIAVLASLIKLISDLL